MTPSRMIAGRMYLAIEDVATCFEVEVAWVREVRDEGLLEVLIESGDELVPARELDRLASIVRLARALGLDLATVEPLL